NRTKEEGGCSDREEDDRGEKRKKERRREKKERRREKKERRREKKREGVDSFKNVMCLLPSVVTAASAFDLLLIHFSISLSLSPCLLLVIQHSCFCRVVVVFSLSLSVGNTMRSFVILVASLHVTQAFSLPSHFAR